MKRFIYTISILVIAIFQVQAQTVEVKGIITDENQSKSVKNVEVKILDKATKRVVATDVTNKNGAFEVEVKDGKEYILIADKENFFEEENRLSVDNLDDLLKLKLERKPGYIFDVNITSADEYAKVRAIEGARIEVYNNTTQTEELVLIDHPKPSFLFDFEEGNHYTLMIRKKGYLNKRIEAYVNIEGCILCFEGMGVVEPNVVDVMANENQIGAFLGNIEMEKVELNKTFKIDNLYYDYDKAFIRPDAKLVLENVLTVLKDNPGVLVEMGSHTDARGSNSYNMNLSDRRAKSAVEYLVSRGLSRENLTWKGYGETQPVNRCTDGVTCSEAMHQDNRRTELKIIGIKDEDPLDKKTLKEIVESEGKNHYLIYQELSQNSKNQTTITARK